MKEFTFTSPLTGDVIPLAVSLKKYNNGRTAIELLEMDPAYGYFPYAVATVNMPEVLLADNEVLIKDYSENEGVLDFLIKYNIVTPTPNGIHSGFVWLPVAILNDESVWGDVPNAYCMNEEPEYDRVPLVASYVNVDNDTNTPNSNGWISMNKLDPAPDEINLDTGKSMWIIKDYRIWADSYQQAVELLPMIESF
jgi:hypothetical protein